MYKNLRALASFYKNNPEYINFYFRSLFGRSQPFYHLIFQITNICNSKCVMCFNWKILNKDVDKELTLEEVEKFTRNLGNLDTVTIGGGEPFLRDDLPEIVDCLKRNNKVKTVAIPTNSLSVNRVLGSVEKMLNNFDGRLKIGLSLDGIGKDHDKIRGIEGNFEKVMEVYHGLAKFKEKYPNLRLRICSVIMNLNVNKITQMIKYVKEEMPAINYHGFDLLKGDYNQEKVGEISSNEFLKIIELWENENKDDRNFQKRVVNPIYQRLLLDILKEKKQLIPCRISNFCPVVDALGNVYPCEDRKKISNLRDFDYDLKKIWQSKQADQTRESIKNKECHCTHSAYQIPNFYLNPKMIWKIIRGKY